MMHGPINIRFTKTEVEPEWIDYYDEQATCSTTEESCFDSRKGREVFLFSQASMPPLGTTRPSVQWVPEAFSRSSSVGVEVDWSHNLYSPSRTHGQLNSYKYKLFKYFLVQEWDYL